MQSDRQKENEGVVSGTEGEARVELGKIMHPERLQACVRRVAVHAATMAIWSAARVLQACVRVVAVRSAVLDAQLATCVLQCVFRCCTSRRRRAAYAQRAYYSKYQQRCTVLQCCCVAMCCMRVAVCVTLLRLAPMLRSAPAVHVRQVYDGNYLVLLWIWKAF